MSTEQNIDDEGPKHNRGIIGTEADTDETNFSHKVSCFESEISNLSKKTDIFQRHSWKAALLVELLMDKQDVLLPQKLKN